MKFVFLKLKTYIIAVVIAILSIVPIAIVVTKPPVKDWLPYLNDYWQGLLILFLCTVVSFFLSNLSKKIEFWSIVVVSVLFLSSFGIIVQFLLAYVYFGALCLIGSSALSANKAQASDDILTNFFAGVCIWGAAAIILSLFGLGNFIQLRVLTILFAVVSYVGLSKKGYTSLIIHYKDTISALKKSPWIKLLFIALTFCILGSATRATIAWDHDSMWYGLRPEKVLIGDNSFYDNLGLTTFVYYYPKLVELLLAPLGNLGEYSYIIMGNVFIYIFILLAVHMFCVKFLGWTLKQSIFPVFIVATVPAISGGAIGAKPDNFGVLCCLLCWFVFYEFLRKKDISLLCYVITLLAFCTAIKPTYLLWGGLLFICIIVSLVYVIMQRNRLNFPPFIFREHLPAFLVSIAGIFFVLGVHLRTLLTVGVPIYPAGVDIFTRLGFSVNYGFRSSYSIESMSLHPTSLRDIFLRFYAFVFDPITVSNLGMQWIGNGLLCLLVVWLLFLNKKRGNSDNQFEFKLFRTSSFFLLCFFLIYYVQTLKLGDGNYYIVPIVLMGLILLEDLHSKFKYDENSFSPLIIKNICLGVVICTQIIWMFGSHPGWSIGMPPFSGEVWVDSKKTWDTKRGDTLSYAGVLNISEYISQELCMETIITDMSSQLWYSYLDGRVISIYELTGYLVSSRISQSYEGFCDYVEYSDTRAFLMMNNTSDAPFIGYMRQYIDENGYNDMVEDREATLYVIRR